MASSDKILFGKPLTLLYEFSSDEILDLEEQLQNINMIYMD